MGRSCKTIPGRKTIEFHWLRFIRESDWVNSGVGNRFNRPPKLSSQLIPKTIASRHPGWLLNFVQARRRLLAALKVAS